ncbi:hypothetical protein BDQ12DRAFT_684172 [Crucibulum laeve]|uniref:Molybdate-anion transporter n=1 Tax=Crucibulum laeve TaxID=68775 RepID=A0A5C3M238_9AGAR|nr:hypothetical protein BDQ12DRAFT_684172 [Crucibulum laeve]
MPDIFLGQLYVTRCLQYFLRGFNHQPGVCHDCPHAHLELSRRAIQIFQRLLSVISGILAIKMGFYEWQLVLLVCVCIVTLLFERYASKRREDGRKKDVDERQATSNQRDAYKALSMKYLVVFGIVMGADWLQGPYLYSLYREQHGFPERFVAALFVTGFVSAGVAAPFIGVWADQHGRRTLCLTFCILYTLTCVLITVPSLPVLILGRILGGISTSILFSAFESWLVSSSNSLSLPSSDLSAIMGKATLLNGFMAATAGVVSNQFVRATKDFTAPFIASGCVLLVGWCTIRATWSENFGSRDDSSETNGHSDPFQLHRLLSAWRIVRQDPRLLVLGLTQTCFEGCMYLFVFLWVPSLQEISPNYPAESPPLGYIFSSFMICMMLGSLLYSTISSRSLLQKPINAETEQECLSVKFHAKLSTAVCATSALALGSSVLFHDERWRFYAFCAFEACVGMYYPVQGMLRGRLIRDENRATVSSLFRVPLNAFVVLSLMTGVASARHAVLTASSGLLAFAALMMWVTIVHSSDLVSAESVLAVDAVDS